MAVVRAVCDLLISDEVGPPTTTPQAAQRANGPDPGIGSHAAAPADGHGEEEEEAPSPRPSSAGCYTFLRSASRRGRHRRLDSSASASAAAHVVRVEVGTTKGERSLFPRRPDRARGRAGVAPPRGGRAADPRRRGGSRRGRFAVRAPVHTPTSSLPSPSWVINSPSSRPLAPPDSVDVIPPLAIVGRRAATPQPLPSHAAGPCRKTSTGHNHRCPLLQQIHATGRRPQSQCDLEVEKLGVGWVGLYEGFEGVCIADHGCGVVLPSWDAGSDRCSGRGDDCFFLGWEPPFADLAATDARISFPVCVPEDLWDASNSSNSDRAHLIPAMFSIMYGKVGISADTPSSTSDSFFSDSLNSSCGQSLIGMADVRTGMGQSGFIYFVARGLFKSVVQVPLAFIVAPDIFRINRDILSFVSCIVSNQIKQTCASIIQDTSDTSSNTKTDLSSDTPSNTTMTGSTKRTFNELCFCAKNVDPTADLKKYIEDLEECLDRSSKFYAVAVNNTFMKQDRVYCTKEFSQDYLKPLMEGKETISIGVQMAGGVSKNMILHMSTDGRCNLKKGWAKFATRNHIYLQSLCTFHFYKITRLEATFDVL
uniref:TF-B3 domain-containing protein n=1 Tax=Oryza glumipatula TaxID=40148 RepID=A0A0D9YRP4_9ORYZ